MPVCSTCGREAPPGSIYCPYCGSQLFRGINIGVSEIVYCHICGYSNFRTSQFCTNCSTRLRHKKLESISPPMRSSPISSTQRYAQTKPYLRQLSLSDSLRKGFALFTDNPKLWIITLLSFTVEFVLPFIFIFFYMGMALSSPSHSLLSFLLVFVIVTGLTLFLVNNFCTSWILTSYRQIRSQKIKAPLNLQRSFIEALGYTPKIVVASFIVVLIESLILGLGFIGLVLFARIYPIAFLLVGFLVLIAVISLFQLFGTYITQSIVLDGRCVFDSLIQSWRFTNKYFVFTLSVSIALFLFSVALSFVIFVSPLAFKIIQTVGTLSFAEAFEDFKHTIDTDSSQHRRHFQSYQYYYH